MRTRHKANAKIGQLIIGDIGPSIAQHLDEASKKQLRKVSRGAKAAVDMTITRARGMPCEDDYNHWRDTSHRVLTPSNWSNLEELDLSEFWQLDYSFIIPELSKKVWPKLRKLTLHLALLTIDNEFDLQKAHWPALSELEITDSTQCTGRIFDLTEKGPLEALHTLLCTAPWPLERLEVVGGVMFEKAVLGNSAFKLKKLKLVHSAMFYHSKISVDETIFQAGLEELTLEGYAMSPSLAALLVEHGSSLKSLTLGDCSIQETEADVLAEARFPHLRSLKLIGMGPQDAPDSDDEDSIPPAQTFSENHIVSLIMNCGTKNLRSLSLHDFPMTLSIAQAISHHLLTALEALSVTGCGLTPEIMQELAMASHRWPLLETLDLSRNLIGDEGYEAFATGQWNSLVQLRLEFTNMSSDSFLSFAMLPWPKLEVLSVRNNPVDNRAAWLPNSVCTFPCLKTLELENTNMDSEMIAMLSEKWIKKDETHNNFEGMPSNLETNLSLGLRYPSTEFHVWNSEELYLTVADDM